MATKWVQIFIDDDLLKRIDRDPETKAVGRSAFLRAALEMYLTATRRREVESRLLDAYDGEADAMLDEIAELLDPDSVPSD